jgi:hypothetical protein
MAIRDRPVVHLGMRTVPPCAVSFPSSISMDNIPLHVLQAETNMRYTTLSVIHFHELQQRPFGRLVWRYTPFQLRLRFASTSSYPTDRQELRGRILSSMFRGESPPR